MLMYVPMLPGLPALNLGLSSFLDGGPLRPRPGFYFQQYLNYYHANSFRDFHGMRIGGHALDGDQLAGITQCIYQFDFLPSVDYGVDATLAYVLSSHVTKNTFGITDSGAGLGDLVIGNYLQFHPIIYHGRPIFVHRLEFSVGFPTGKDKFPLFLINPGSKFFYINPYWAFTYYVTHRLATSWRIHYLWCGKNHKANYQAGDAFHFNYTLEWEAMDNLWIGMNGYFLQQLSDDRFNDNKVPGSRERVFGIGPGFLYIPNPETFDLFLFANLYFESDARVRPQGINFVLHLLKYFG